MHVVEMEQAALWEPVLTVAPGTSHHGAVRAAAGAVALPADAGSVRRFRAKCAPATDAGNNRAVSIATAASFLDCPWCPRPHVLGSGLAQRGTAPSYTTVL
jgi:hypothetical protein